MSTKTFAEIWQPCLGKRLASGKRRLLHANYADPELDLAEVMLCFDAPGLVRYLSWAQTAEDWELDVREQSHLIDEPFPEVRAEDDRVLSQALGKHHMAADMFENEIGELAAAALHFEDCCFVVALGNYEWDVEKEEAVFRYFFGDDVFLWTPEQFVNASRVSTVKLVKRIEA